MMKKKIIVTGGSGMVGRSLKDIMPDAIYLSSKEYDLTNQMDVRDMLRYHEPTHIIHLAAKVGGIIDNINKPADYFTENVLMNTILMDESYKFGVTRFISILSSCIYPDIMGVYPMKEEVLHYGPPTPTNFSYAYAKRCVEVQTTAYNNQYGTKYQYLTPCNLYGEYDKWGENSHFIAALIKKIIIAKQQNKDSILLFGTGNPLRQFMHSNDLAYVIKKCIDDDIYTNMNVATPEILSIHQMAEIALKACDAEHLKIIYDSTKPDGQYRKDISIEKLKKSIPSFKPISLLNGIKQTYDKISNGYNR